MTQHLTAIQQFTYDIHPKYGRPVLENRFAARSHTAVAVCGWEMMRAIGLPTVNGLLKETGLGAFSAMTMPIDLGYQKALVANTSLGEGLNARIAAELRVLHDFNRDYYWQARVFGHRIEFMHLPPSSEDDKRNSLNQDTGVTEEVLRQLLNEGYDIYPDRNDPRLVKLTADAQLFEVTSDLNDKNEFYRFLRKSSGQFDRPLSVCIDCVTLEILTELESLPEEDALARFARLLDNCTIAHEGVFDPTINYFIKVAGGAGGNELEHSMCRLYPDPENEDGFKSILKNLIRRMTAKGAISRGVQLQEPIDASTPNTSNPFDSANTSAFSPCLTLRIGPHGRYKLGQVADQVLAHGLSCVGSYWNQAWEDAFVASHAKAIDNLAQSLSRIGFRGYFGTDFVRTTTGSYKMTIDGNARMNMSDMLYLVRKPLELQGVKVRDAYMGEFSFEADDEARAQALEELCGPYRYSNLRFAGVTVWPAFVPDTLLGKSKKRAGVLIYINPSYEPEKFSEFLELVQ